MKRSTYTLFLSASALLLIVVLSACVRPVPGSEARPEATATPGALINPTFPPLSTPGGDLVLPTDTAPVGASPTPAVIEGGGEQVVPPGPEATIAPVPETTAPTAEPPPAEQPQPTAAPGGETIHVVQPGENLFRIGLRYGFTAEELARYNNIPNVNVIYVGQEIRIPPK